MISLWRRDWVNRTSIATLATVPFGFVQIGPRDCIPCEDHQGATGTFYGGIRWSQTGFYYSVPNVAMPNTFMAVAADLAEGYSPVLDMVQGCVHYGNKQDVGSRLALGVRKHVYGEDSLVATGPMLVSTTTLPSSSQSKVGRASASASASAPSSSSPSLSSLLQLHFDVEISGTIEVRNTSGFEISTNGAFYTAALITSHTNTSVTLTSPDGVDASAIVSLRYILHDTPCINKTCAIYGKDSGLPSPPLVANLPGHPGADPVGWNIPLK